MNIEIPGIAKVHPLDGMPPEQFQRIVNQVLAHMTRRRNMQGGDGSYSRESSERYMSMVRESRPLTAKELAIRRK